MKKESFFYLLWGQNLEQFETAKPSQVVWEEINNYIPKTFYKLKSKNKPYDFLKYLNVYGFDKGVDFKDNVQLDKMLSRAMMQAQKEGYRYIVIYLPQAQIRTVHVQGRSLPYTSYENVYVNGQYGSTTIRVPQQQYINIPDRDVPVLDVMVSARVYEVNKNFSSSKDFMDNCFVANSIYSRSREYRGGRVMDVANEGMTIVTRELFGKKTQ